MQVKLYTTHCPKCNVLVKKLIDKGIKFEEVTDVDTMSNMGIVSVPILEVDGKMMSFLEATNWINGGCK